MDGRFGGSWIQAVHVLESFLFEKSLYFSGCFEHKSVINIRTSDILRPELTKGFTK